MSKCIREPATIALSLGDLCDADLWDVLRALVAINARVYETGQAPPPWSLRWKPDNYGRTATMRDARVLERRGYGSCHELAAAYAGYLKVNGDPRADVEVLDVGPRDWHIVAITSDGRVFDPQTIGQS